MAAVLATLGWLVLGVVLTLAALLFVPADYVISAGTGSGVRFRVRWLFGLVRMTYVSPGRTEKPPERVRGSGRGARLAQRLLVIDGLGERLVRLARELLRSLGWRRGRVALRVGLGDPADTGELCGLVGTALVVLPPPPGVQVTFQPDFAEATFAARADGSGRFVPARAIAAFGRFAASPPGWRWIGVMLWQR